MKQLLLISKVGIIVTLCGIIAIIYRVEGGEFKEEAGVVSKKCSSLDSLSSLSEFNQFYSSYNKIYQCLLLTEPTSECQEAEQTCQDNGILYSSVAELGQLLNRRQQGQRTCTIEFAVRLYRMHDRLSQINTLENPAGGAGLLRILRVFANRWAAKCKAGLASRFEDIEQRAPDARKHLDLILGIMSYGTENGEVAGSLDVDVEYFIPVLEDELKSKYGSFGRQLASGFEYSLSPTHMLTLRGAQGSCEALKPYYMNILGSLGLLASKGYGASSIKSYSDEDNDDAADEKKLVEEWILVASVCQSLKLIYRQSSVNVKGQLKTQVKLSALSEPDVSHQDEYDYKFSDYKLKGDNTPLDLSIPISSDDLKIFPINIRANLRKLQLIDGPNERLASSLYAYLDMSAFKLERMRIPYRILGIAAPKNLK